MPVLPAPTPKTYDRAAFLPARRSTEADRTAHSLPPNNDWIGGLFDAAGNFIEESAMVRADIYQILGARNLDIEPAYVDEDVIYGGFIYRDHYGHFLTESLARLWFALKDRTKRYVFHSYPGSYDLSEMNHFFFEACGLKEEQILIPREPTRFRSITIPSAGVAVGSENCLAPQRDLFGAIRRKVIDDSQPSADGPPIFFSRAKLAPRRVHGEEQIEKLMHLNGYRVVYPETMSVEEQIRIVNSTNVFCAVVGSALHNLVFTLNPSTIYYIERTSNTPHTLKTFKALDGLLDHNGFYLDVSANSLPTFGQGGPFMINVQKTQDELLRLGAITKPANFAFDPERTQREYEEDWRKTYPNHPPINASAQPKK